MTITEKMVDYFKHCKTCKHKDLPDFEGPCNTCLTEPFNEDSTYPVGYEPKE